MSDANRDLAVRKGVGTSAKHVTIHNGVADHPLRTQPSEARVPRIVMLARFAPQKAQSLLVKAVEGIDMPFELAFVGDGPTRGAVQKQVADAGLADRVVFLGQRLDVAEILASADIFALFTHWEGFPITILEAVAKARGIETGLFEQNTVELADLPRSFLVRGSKRMKVDFEKLFFEGDMSQNIELEPGDYLYFASANTNEVYVLGSVNSPGIEGFTPRMTIISAISQREGFTADAYREHVLVVRGSLNSPKVFVVNVDDIVHGRAPNFPLEPKDIVYVSDHPWKFADQLLDIAISAFVQSAVTSWTSANVGPFITSPILPTVQIQP